MYRKKRISLVDILILLLILVFLVSAATFFIRWEKAADEKQKFELTSQGIVTIDGQSYKQRNLTTFLLIGIDKLGEIESSEYARNQKQADFLALVVLDKKNAKYSIVHLNRDSMVQVEELSITGQRTGKTLYQQLALAYTYGDGATGSCQNTRRTVSRMFYGLDIDHYISMTMDAVVMINDELGGVPVTIPDDYTHINPLFVKDATVTLLGNSVMDFIRSRTGVDDGTNIARMKRQKIYIRSFAEQLRSDKMTDTLISDLAKKVAESDNICTDCSVYELNRLSETLKTCDFSEIRSPEGTAQMGKTYVEFIPDQTSIDQLSKELFFDVYEK